MTRRMTVLIYRTPERLALPGCVATPLARRGYRVTVLDRSEHFLAEGRRRAKEASVEIKWVDGDMQEIPLGPHFDAIIYIFPSLGYFDDDKEAVHLARSVRTGVPTVQTILPWLGARLASGRRSGNPA
jgi:ubiquinone/menaquinone biosynthesis C-methylase UbiE